MKYTVVWSNAYIDHICQPVINDKQIYSKICAYLNLVLIKCSMLCDMDYFKISNKLLILLSLIKYGAAYKIACDDWWTGFSESSSCYLFMHHHPETYTDAKQICEKYDSHLLIIDTIPEKVGIIFVIFDREIFPRSL